MILALGTYGTEGLSPAEREPLIVKLLDLYRTLADLTNLTGIEDNVQGESLAAFVANVL